MAALAESLNALADALDRTIRLDEKGRPYYYDTVNEKRWVTDGDPCELCQENEDMGWIPDEGVFQGVFGDVDDGEAHPHCMCQVEYRERRVRVYT